MQLSIEAGTIKHPIAYEKYVDESFAQRRAARRRSRSEPIDASARGLLLLSLLAAARRRGAARPATPRRFKAGVFDPPRAAPDFSLRGSDGARAHARPLSRQGRDAGLRLHVTARTSARRRSRRWPRRASKLGAEAEDVQVVYVTVDPERDDAARMREYLALRSDLRRRHRHAGAARGGAQELRRHRRRSKATGSSYAVDHSSSIYLIDRDGQAARADALRARRRTTTCTTSRILLASERVDAPRASDAVAALVVARAARRRACSRWAALAPIDVRRRARSSSRSRRAPGRGAWPATRSRSCRTRSA